MSKAADNKQRQTVLIEKKRSERIYLSQLIEVNKKTRRK